MILMLGLSALAVTAMPAEEMCGGHPADGGIGMTGEDASHQNSPTGLRP